MTATPHTTGPRRHPAAPSRFAGMPGRTLAVLVALATALLVALFLAPGPLAASGSGGDSLDEGNLAESFREAFVEYWNAGNRDFSPDMRRVVDYWLRYHVVKAVVAATLLIVLVALGVLVWRAFLRAGDLGAGHGAALASAGVLVTLLALFASVTMAANIQGAVAPFASLLSMLPTGATEGELAVTLDRVRQQLTSPSGAAGRTPPPLDVMIDDFARYHVAMAVLGAIVAVVLIGSSVVSGKRFARTESSDRRRRRVFGAFGVLSALVSLVVIVVVVANTGNATDPRSGLSAFFEGGW
ncbi:hypothetical protein [Embleya scabrispora]|uniref:hypothetical protein n=1 Tax=Embleya scabrispora TaxID=159449 RepID=UPI0004778641|nr:hypothetical protein [Embleya scabrispora]